MKTRIRLLPAVIFLSGFAVALKLGAVWQGIDGMFASPAIAAEEQPAAGKDTKSAGPEIPTDSRSLAAAAPAGSGDENSRSSAWFDPASITDAELEILQKLSERRKELEDREQELEVRARLLEATEKRIDAKIVELKEIRDTVASLLEKHDAQQAKKMESLVNIYEAMKPKDAARIFEELDMAILLDVVERMKERKAAPIMAEMSPAKAKAMTAALAQRRALPEPESERDDP